MSHGGKGIIIDVVPRAELGADICMDPTSLPGRTNPGRIIEMYVGGSSRNAKEIISHDFHTNGLESAFNLLIDYLSHYDTEQYLSYKHCYDNRSQPNNLILMREIIMEICEKELYLYYKIRSRKKAVYVIRSLESSALWSLKKRSVLIDGKMSRKPITVAPLYVLLLAKTADSYLSCSSPYLNHYGIPVKPPSNVKVRKPWSNTPTKVSGETELRVMSTNTENPEYVAEMISRNTNIDSHRKIYRTLLTHKTPTNIPHIDTRVNGLLPDGAPLAMFKSVMRTMGIGITTIKEKDEYER